MEFVIYPFSFAEFLELYRPITPDDPIQKCFQKYLLSGGMPYLANIRYEDAPSKLYLHDLFNSVQLKDIVTRNKIRDIDLLERIIAYVIANVGTTFSATSLAKFFKNEKRTVAPETILNYIKYCCDAYLFYQVKREDLQGKQILASNETVRREFGAYDNIRDNYPKYVVSLDEFDMSRNGIKHRNIRDFLLAEEWN